MALGRGSRCWRCACAAGCALATEPSPGCSPQESLYTLVLTAESVRSATLIPCLRPLQPGWEIELLDARNDRSRFVLSSDRGGENALTVDLVAECDVTGATQVPSDEPGTDRFEEVTATRARLRRHSQLRLPGGCVRFRFDLDTSLASGLLNEATLMVGFVSSATPSARSWRRRPASTWRTAREPGPGDSMVLNRRGRCAPPC